LNKELPETTAVADPKKRTNPKMITNSTVLSGKFNMKTISTGYYIL